MFDFFAMAVDSVGVATFVLKEKFEDVVHFYVVAAAWEDLD